MHIDGQKYAILCEPRVKYIICLEIYIIYKSLLKNVDCI